MVMRTIFTLLGFVLATAVGQAADIRVLSAGAVEPGIEAFAHQLDRKSTRLNSSH